MESFFPLKKDIREIPLSSLAYIGDALYELYVREAMLHDAGAQATKLHRLSVSCVKANFQAELVHFLQDQLREEEKTWLLRGRNADPKSMAKNQDPQNYRWATGFEVLLAYLYYQDRERCQEILSLCRSYWLSLHAK